MWIYGCAEPYLVSSSRIIIAAVWIRGCCRVVTVVAAVWLWGCRRVLAVVAAVWLLVVALSFSSSPSLRRRIASHSREEDLRIEGEFSPLISFNFYLGCETFSSSLFEASQKFESAEILLVTVGFNFFSWIEI